MSRWYRAYEGTTADPKLHEAAMSAGCSRSIIIAVWGTILEACAKNDASEPDIPARRIAVILAEPVEIIEKSMVALEEVGLISNGAVTSWSKRQFSSDNAAARVRKHRSATTRPCNGHVTACNGHVTPPETETETETEKIREEAPAPPSPPARVSQDRHKHGSEKNVLLTDQQYRALADELGEDMTRRCIEELSQAKAMKGYVYKRDDLAIRKWVVKAVQEKQTRRAGNVTVPDRIIVPDFTR